MEDLRFAPSRPFTLGVELEFQILDRDTLNLVPMAPTLLAGAPEDMRDRVAPEFLRSILEVRTRVCNSTAEVEDDLREGIGRMEQVAEDFGCLLYSTSLHPFAEPADQVLSEGERYHRIMEELQYVGRQFISQGMHVHVGIGDGETAITVCEVLQAYLPPLLGLSASSPFFRGEDTGLCSYRTKLFEALPLAGVAGYLDSWQAYVDEINLLRSSKVIKKVKDLWWDVRPSPGFGTVEVRICDVPARFMDVLGLTSLIQSLAAAAAEGVVRPKRVSPQLLRCNKWQAARHGLQGRFNDSLGLLATRTQPIGAAVVEMIDVLAPFLDRFDARGMKAMEDLLKNGISASRQRRIMVKEGRFETMIREMRSVYWQEFE